MKKGTVIVGFILSFISGMMLMWGVDRGRGVTATKDAVAGVVEGTRKVNPGAPRVDLFVMSQCPYGVQAVNGFKDVMDKLGADVDLRVEFIGEKSPQGELTSMHGPKEVKGNLAQICAMKYSPKWFDLLLCQNKNMREVDTNWEACAKETGVPADKVKACMDGEEGKKLLGDSFQRAKEKGARGSPTIYIGGQQYQGGRRAPDFFKAVCNAFTGKKPEACANIPESPKVNVTLIGDKRCAECDTKRIEGMIRQRVANPVLTTVDYADAAGKALYDQIKGTQLPAAVFDATLDGDKEAAMAFARNMKPVGNYKVVSMGGAWNPVCADEGGCDKDECKNTLQCRKEVENTLEVFVMSQCPFGVKGLDAMQEVLKNFDNKIDFQVHFIGQGDAAKGLTSMHGQGEVDEDMREICAIKKYPKNYKFMDYIWCRDKNIKDTNWESCTGEKVGIDAKAIKKCFDGEDGKKLLEESFKYSAQLGFGASPTWLVNGKYKFSGVDPETINTNFCAHNKLKGCENKLSGPPAAPAGGQAAQPAGCGAQ
jgi:predicted DsbA family dithiol-disulfide isomerase